MPVGYNLVRPSTPSPKSIFKGFIGSKLSVTISLKVNDFSSKKADENPHVSTVLVSGWIIKIGMSANFTFAAPLSIS